MDCRYYILFKSGCIKFNNENDYIEYVDKNYRILKDSKLFKSCGHKIFDSIYINMNHSFENPHPNDMISYQLFCRK